MQNPIEIWHKAIKDGDPALLDEMLADDCIFYSPIVFTPQKGKMLTKMYLMAAYAVLMQGGFHYLKEIITGNNAVLEFSTVIDEIEINGVDMLEWNAEGKVTEFKVMVRPLKAVHKVQEKMAEMMQSGMPGI